MRPPCLLTSSQTMYSVSHASSLSPHLFTDHVLSLSCILPVSSPLHRPCTQSLMRPPCLLTSSQTMYSVSHASSLSPHLFTDHVLSLSCILHVSSPLHRPCTQSLMHPPLSPHLFTDHVLSLSCILPVSSPLHRQCTQSLMRPPVSSPLHRPCTQSLMHPPCLLTSSQTMYSVSHASSLSPHLFTDHVLSLSCILPVSSPLHRPCTQSLMRPPRLPSSSQTMYSVSHASSLSPHLFTDSVLSLSCILPVSPALHRQCT